MRTGDFRATALVALTALGLTLLGLGALMAASAAAFTVVKWLGAGYLLWLGWRLWSAPAETPPPLPARRAFRDAFVVTVLNPKSIGFFVAFLPQFLDPALPLAGQGAMLLFTFVAIGTLKVFDVVRTMTGGRFGTSVIANEFYTQSFTQSNRGIGAALAVVASRVEATTQV